MKFSACIEMLYTEYSFIERIYKAAEDGFSAIEFWLWQNKDLEAIKKALKQTGIKTAVFQGNVGGRMIDPKDNSEYISGVRTSINTAKELGASHLFLMTDILKEDRTVLETDYPITEKDKQESIIEVLSTLADDAMRSDINLVIEPLNTTVDHKGYYLNGSSPAFSLVRDLNCKNIKVLYDIYHMQIMEGNIINTIKNNIDTIGYIHVADVPGRAQPGTGEINYRNVLYAIEECGYEGYVGLEFSPANITSSQAAKNTMSLLDNKAN